MVFAFNGVPNASYSNAIAIILSRNMSNWHTVFATAIRALAGIGRYYAAAFWTF